MPRKPIREFVSTDPQPLIAAMTAKYEQMMGVTVAPANPVNLFIRWLASERIQERVLINYTASQNTPSRAEGVNLDILAELFYLKERPGVKPAFCTVRFFISETHDFDTLIPAGIRLSDKSGVLTWVTESDEFVAAGLEYADVRVICTVPGTIGNGYLPGQINTLTDNFPYYSHCENITESDGGSDAPTDDEFYELLRMSEDAYSTAGADGAYVYWAKQVSTEIADVIANSPYPGHIRIYTLMKDGSIATEELKREILTACNGEEHRPMTDYVQTADAETIEYDVDVTYYLSRSANSSAAAIEQSVDAAVADFVLWQSGALGRDINPSELEHRIMGAGVKRVVIRAPAFTVLRDARDEQFPDPAVSVPQVAAIGSVNIVNGGYENA